MVDAGVIASVGRRRATFSLIMCLVACCALVGCGMLLESLEALRTIEHVQDAVRESDGFIDMGKMSQVAPDSRAWLTVDSAGIGLPVAQGEEGDPTYYLAHDINGEASPSGAPFVDWRCWEAATECPQHLLVYGHHLGVTGGMFSPLYHCWQQGEFERLCASGADWYEPGARARHFVPLCALRVREDYAPIQVFSWQDLGHLRAWLRDMARQSSATAPDWERTVQGATRCLTLVTCSSDFSGQAWRTLVLFVEDTSSTCGETNT